MDPPVPLPPFQDRRKADGTRTGFQIKWSPRSIHNKVTAMTPAQCYNQDHDSAQDTVSSTTRVRACRP